MEINSDVCAWPELVYRFIEFYKWEPQHLRRGQPVKEFQDGVRRGEVPLNFLFLRLLRWSPPETIRMLVNQFGLNDDSELGDLLLAFSQDTAYTQPDVRIESETARVFIELKVDSKIKLEQVHKYLLLHAELDIASGGEQPYLFVLTRSGFAKHWAPRGEATNDIQAFLYSKTINSPLREQLAKRIRDPRLLARYELVKRDVRYGAATWKSVGQCLASICEQCKQAGGRDTDVRIISDFVGDLERRGLMV